MNNEEIIKKFLIHPPDSNYHATRLFPLLHALNAEEGKKEINIIINEEETDVFGVLPFEVKVFKIPKSKKDSFFGIHHFAYNLIDVFNIDYYIDLAGNFKSAFFGCTFRSKTRISYKTGLNKYLLTHAFESKDFQNDSTSLDRKALFLWESFLEKGILNSKVAGVEIKELEKKEIEEKLQEENIAEVIPLNNLAIQDNPFVTENEKRICIVINGSLFDDGSDVLFAVFFDCFVGKKFLICVSNIEKEKINSWVKSFDKRNKFEVLYDLSISQLKEEILNSEGVVTDSMVVADLSCYFNKKNFVFEHENVEGKVECRPDNFLISSNKIILQHDKKIVKKLITKDESKQLDDVAAIVDFLHKEFEI